MSLNVEQSLIYNDEESSFLNEIELGFVYKHFIQPFFPYKKQDKTIYKRYNNFCTISLMTSSANVGLPYGALPRILLIWLMTEAIKNKTNKFYLPRTISTFVSELGFRKTGGIRGDITRIKDQFIRLTHTAYSLKLNNSEKYYVYNIFPIKRAELWWQKRDKNDKFDAYIELSEDFYAEIQSNSMPVNMNFVKVLKDSCLALDIYIWLCYRFGYLKDKIFIPWSAIKQQFGSDYKEDSKGIYNFKIEFISQLKKVLNLYHNAKIIEAEDKKGVVLYPSPLSVPRNVERFRTFNSQKDKNILTNDDNILRNNIYTRLIKEFSLSKIYADKIITKDVQVLSEALRAADNYIKQNKINNLQGVIKKALDEEWKTQLFSDENQQSLSFIEDNEIEITNSAWKLIREKIKKQIGEAAFKSWIAKLHFIKEEKDHVVFGTSNKFIKEYIVQKHLDSILYHWRTVNSNISYILIDHISS